MSLSPVARSAARTPPLPPSNGGRAVENGRALYIKGAPPGLSSDKHGLRRLSVKGTQRGCLQSLTHKLAARVLQARAMPLRPAAAGRRVQLALDRGEHPFRQGHSVYLNRIEGQVLSLIHI